MALGDILCGRENGQVVYGKNNTIVYEDLHHILLTISWEDGNDVDILGRFTGSDVYVGWGQGSSTIKVDAFYAHWRGDNTQGGPEYIDIYASADALKGDKSFEVYCNWYTTGEGHAGGPVTITATDEDEHSVAVSFDASRRYGYKAEVTDPGAKLTFTEEGKVKNIVKIN